MVALFALLEKRPFVFALVFAAMPYFELRLYLSGVMHADEALATAPSAELLLALLVVGAIVPAVFLVVVLRRLVAERESFELCFRSTSLQYWSSPSPTRCYKRAAWRRRFLECP